MDQKIVIDDIEVVSEIRKSDKKRKRNKGFFVGVIINILAIVGLVAIIILSSYLFRNLFSNTKEKNEWAEYVQPVVMNNLHDFTNVEDISKDNIRMIAIWSFLLNTDIDSLDHHEESDDLLVPESEVAKQAARLFGKNYKMDHGSVDAPDVNYPYDEELKAYMVGQSYIQVNTAIVTEVVREKLDPDDENGKEYLKLTVGYLPPASPWELNQDGSRDKGGVEKYAYYYIDDSDKKNPFIAALVIAVDLNRELIGLSPIDIASIVDEDAGFSPSNQVTSSETSPDATSPDATSPDATSPDATSPDATSPDATSSSESSD